MTARRRDDKMGKPRPVPVGAAWYRSDQWDRLREVSEDRTDLENTWEEWVQVAEKSLRFSGQGDSESVSSSATRRPDECKAIVRTAAGIPITFQMLPFDGLIASDPGALRLHLEYWQLHLLRDFDQLLCLEGLTGVEHLPHQIETVRKVLRRFRGRVLLADEVGLGKTIEACLLLREYLLRGLAKRVLILVPTPLVSQWREELASKFHLEFSTPLRTGTADHLEYWQNTDRVLASMAFAKSRKRAELVAEVPWDLVIVDEAHHCKNRATQNWRLVNALKRRHLFLLSATPVQNNLLELYNLLTLLEPGHLKTETDFKRQYVRRGNPRDPRKPRAAAVAAGRGDGPQHAESGPDGPAGALCPDNSGPAARRRSRFVRDVGRLFAAATGAFGNDRRHASRTTTIAGWASMAVLVRLLLLSLSQAALHLDGQPLTLQLGRQFRFRGQIEFVA